MLQERHRYRPFGYHSADITGSIAAARRINKERKREENRRRGPYRNLRTDKALERKRERETMENTSAKTNGGIRRRIGSERERKKERYETKERRRVTGGIQKGDSRKKESAKGEMRREEEKENAWASR